MSLFGFDIRVGFVCFWTHYLSRLRFLVVGVLARGRVSRVDAYETPAAGNLTCLDQDIFEIQCLAKEYKDKSVYS